MKRAISIILILHFIASQCYAGGAISSFSNSDKLAVSLSSDPNINPDRSKPLRNDIAGKAEPGAIGNGIVLMELAQGKLPPRATLQSRDLGITASKLREGIHVAIKLSIANKKKVPTHHQERFHDALDNLIDLQNNLEKRSYLYNADIRTSEDYLLGFSFRENVGLSLSLINKLYSISSTRLAQYIFHECVPEKGIITGRDDHRVVYNEIQSAIFGQNEVLALKQDLREFIDERTGGLTVPAQSQPPDNTVHSASVVSGGDAAEIGTLKTLLRNKVGDELGQVIESLADIQISDASERREIIALIMDSLQDRLTIKPGMEDIDSLINEVDRAETSVPGQIDRETALAERMNREAEDYIKQMRRLVRFFRKQLNTEDIDILINKLNACDIEADYTTIDMLIDIIDSLPRDYFFIAAKEDEGRYRRFLHIMDRMVDEDVLGIHRKMWGLYLPLSLFTDAKTVPLGEHSKEWLASAFIKALSSKGDLYYPMRPSLLDAIHTDAGTMKYAHPDEYNPKENFAFLFQNIYEKGYSLDIQIKGKSKSDYIILCRISEAIANALVDRYFNINSPMAKDAEDFEGIVEGHKFQIRVDKKTQRPSLSIFVSPIRTSGAKPNARYSASGIQITQPNLMAQISEDLPVRAKLLQVNFARILSKHPDQLFFMGIETGMGGSQKAQIMPIYKAIDEIQGMKDTNGKTLFPNLMVRRAKAAELTTMINDLNKEGRLNLNNAFIGARKISVDNKAYDSIKGEGRVWISAIDDSIQGDYLPVFEAITLNMMAYLNADASAIKNFYDAISDKPIEPGVLQDMLKNRIIYILPKATKFDTKQLRKLYELAQQVYVAA